MSTDIRLSCALALLLPVVATSASLAAEPTPSTTDKLSVAAGELAVADVKGLIDRKETLYVFDANEHESYVAGHIPGAQWVQFNAVTAAKLPKSKDAKLLFYCYNPQCGASPLAAKTALGLGYRNVWLMPEGITGWRSAHMPIVAGENPK